MADYEIQRERIVEREVPTTGRRTVVEHRGAGFGGWAGNPAGAVIAALVIVFLVLLLLGVLV